jgi:hypothetical protein
MGNVRPRRPSASMLVAMIALSVALGGSAIAADALTKSDVKKIAKKQAGKQIKKKVKPTLPIAFGHIDINGNLTEALSENLRSTHGDNAGRYCFEVLKGSPRNVQASVDYNDSPGGARAPQVNIGDTDNFDCPSNADEFAIQAYDSAGVIDDMALYVLVR